MYKGDMYSLIRSIPDMTKKLVKYIQHWPVRYVTLYHSLSRLYLLTTKPHSDFEPFESELATHSNNKYVRCHTLDGYIKSCFYY